ncbi:hypothetical protein AAKU55_002288 [Oxalobacteraceae bacterium GrIS 1.11]
MSTAIGSVSPYTASLSAPAAAPVAPANSVSNASIAVSLSGEASVVATLGGGAGTVQLYSPQGLLNAIEQAGTAPTPSATAPSATPPADTQLSAQQSAQQSLDQSLLGTLSGAAPTSGIYSSSGVLGSLGSDSAATDWAGILNNNPGAAGTVIADSFAQGIIASL